MGFLVHVLMVVGLLGLAVVRGFDRALGLVDFVHSSSPCGGPYCLHRLCIVSSDSCTALRS